nr:iron-containing alcohol dehydrogenase [Pelotomaculum sp. FP]
MFSDVDSEPGFATAGRVTILMRLLDTDCLVALGGGSLMDVAKGARVLFENGGEIGDYVGENKVIFKPKIPLLSIPTTAGTGSEVTIFAVFTDCGQNKKVTIASEYLASDIAFVDPLMMISAPARITAASGIDALSHAIEAYISTISSPYSDTLAIKAIDLITTYLEPAVADGKDIVARTNVALGSTLAGMALNNASLGLTHSIGASLSGHVKVSHGVAIGIMLPYVMEYNLTINPYKFADLACAMGMSFEGKTLHTVASSAVRTVKTLVKNVGLPTHLREIGISEDSFASITETTLKHDMVKFSPRIPTAEDILVMLKNVY